MSEEQQAAAGTGDTPAHIAQEETFLQRLLREHGELQDRHDRLQRFIGSEAYEALPGEDQSLLVEQIHAMKPYLDVLTRRVVRATAVN